MAGDPEAVENSKKEAREPAHVNLVGGQASGGTDRIVVGELHVRRLRIPIVLLSTPCIKKTKETAYHTYDREVYWKLQ